MKQVKSNHGRNAPATAVLFHNLADEVGPMGGANLDLGPMSNVLAEYLAREIPSEDGKTGKS